MRGRRRRFWRGERDSWGGIDQSSSRLSEQYRIDVLLYQPFQSLDARLEFRVFPAQSLHGDHQDAFHIAGVERRRSSYGANAIVPEGGEELLGHGSVVTELLRIMTNVVPACEAQATDLPQYLFTIDRSKVFLVGSCRR